MKIPKVPVWFPYVEQIRPLEKNMFLVEYKGGSAKLNLKSVLSLLIYGISAPLDQEVLEKITAAGIPIIIHRRNRVNSIIIHSTNRPDKQDILTKQILAREDTRRRKYISRTLLQAKINTLEFMMGIPSFERISGSITKMRAQEARYAKVYWREFYQMLGYPQETRRSKNPVTTCLDACSKFVSSIILRWTTYHHLSPHHGYLHQPTEYPSLVYDLIEPYRYMIDQSVKTTYLKNQTLDVGLTIAQLQKFLHEEVFCPQTRQYIRRQELLHGVVLALRAYLLGYGARLVIPLEGPHKTGRPIKSNYTLPGKSAGYSRIYRPAISSSSIN